MSVLPHAVSYSQSHTLCRPERQEKKNVISTTTSNLMTATYFIAVSLVNERLNVHNTLAGNI